ncbi:Aromatic-l-amino-acid decarboxylase [Plakobranchus ocellatus]|uniref:Aromatic-L-amino-acid decarboxylase n=1 Tax=Plakobranchus ocellatus TaxID=259542 RepID=A0AAV4DQT5_9GAST|nr:Aromatic-l-amino-acid decarboxylase [Plakobranchus ocellatus]
MNPEEFRRCGTDMVQYIADYMETIRSRLPSPDVQPGYLQEQIPDEAPFHGETWEDVKNDLERVVMKGTNHWRSPHFHAFLPLASSFPALLGDMLAGALISAPFSWTSNPAGTELEMSMMDWLAKMLQLPQQFLFSSGGKGGGCIQASADDAALVAILSARAKVIQQFKDMTKGQVLDKLIAYTSEEGHTSVLKAAQLAFVQIRCLKTDEKFALRGTTLAAAVQEDRKQGLIPFFVCATVGTTSTCAIDNLSELGPILLNNILFKSPQMAAYESAMLYILHWHVQLTRPFGSLKMWFVLRMYGVDGLQQRIRKDIAMAKEFKALVLADSRFEIVADVVSGLVCFRLKGENALNKKLLAMIDKSRRICITPSISRGIFYLRFCISVCTTESRDLAFAWEVIQHEADALLSS